MTEHAENHQPPDEETEEEGGQGLLELHREFILHIEDRNRISYSVLGIGTVVVVILLFVVTRTAVFSLAGLGLAAGGGLMTLVLARVFGLARHEAYLRRKVEAYCRDNDLSLEDLLEEAIRTGRFEFFVKLFVPVARPQGQSD